MCMKDLSGKRINAFVVESFNRYENKKYYWNCKCDCGKSFVTCGNNLRRKNGLEMKSCGCLRGNGIWKGHGEISLTYFSQIVNNARKRNIPFKITIEDIWELFLEQNRKCLLSGVELKFSRVHHLSRTEQTASLDRIHSDKPYTIDNVMWVHKDLNMMRSRVSLDIFLKWCKIVADYESPLRSISADKVWRHLEAHQDPSPQEMG